jgi:hypothetical protein
LTLNQLRKLTSCCSSTVIEDVTEHPPTGAAVAYLYFDFRDSEKQGYAQFLRSLLVQLGSQNRGTFNVLRELHDSYGNVRRRPGCTALVGALCRAIEALPLVYVILDALDECQERDDQLEVLEGIVGWRLPNFRLMSTSRQLADIENTLSLMDVG